MYKKITKNTYKKITKDMFRDEFKNMGRQDNFSYEGLGLLYDYLIRYEDCDSFVGTELDVIAICCSYSEYTLDEFHEQFPEETHEDSGRVVAWDTVGTDLVIICMDM